jgi:CBS domain-containing protein
MPHFAMPVSLFMSAPVVTIREDETLEAAQHLLHERAISCLAVVGADDRCSGVLSRTDLLRVGRIEAKGRGRPGLLALPDLRVRDAMHPDVVVSVSPSTSVAAAAREMVSRRFHRVFVAEGPRLAGVFSTKDVLRAIVDKRIETPIAEVMSSPAFTIRTSEPLSMAADRLERARISGLCVVDEEGWPVGTFTQTEALAARDLPGQTPMEEVMSYAMLCLDVRTPLFRAAAQAHATHARRVLAVEERRVKGVLTGLDFARAASTG